MGKVLTHMTMSLDGFIADPQDQPGELFDWYDAGDVDISTANDQVSFHVDAVGAELIGDITADTGALVAGRRLFGITDGWGDHHPVGAPVVVVTHHPPEDADRWPRTAFVNGVDAAIERAKQIASDKNVCISSPNIAQQALALGLVDEVWVSLAPVVFGEGIPYLAGFKGGHLLLDDPMVVQGHRALHLKYRVRRQEPSRD